MSRLHCDVRSAFLEASAENESLKMQVKTAERVIISGQTHASSSAERDTLLWEELEAYKSRAVVWISELDHARQELSELS